MKHSHRLSQDSLRGPSSLQTENNRKAAGRHGPPHPELSKPDPNERGKMNVDTCDKERNTGWPCAPSISGLLPVTACDLESLFVKSYTGSAWPILKGKKSAQNSSSFLPKWNCSALAAEGTGATGTIQVEKGKQTIPLKIGQGKWKDFFPKKTFKWPMDTEKDTQETNQKETKTPSL